MSLPASVSTAAAVERGWEELWPQLALRDGFWLAYLFGSDLNVIRELTQRAQNYARMRVGRTEVRWVAEPDELTAALQWLLSGHGSGHDDLTLAWVVGVGERGRWLPAWTGFLRRLNERRDLLRRALPAGVALVLPGGTLDAARDAAPDLWSYRSTMIELSSAPAAAGVATPRVEVIHSDPTP